MLFRREVKQQSYMCRTVVTSNVGIVRMGTDVYWTGLPTDIIISGTIIPLFETIGHADVTAGIITASGAVAGRQRIDGDEFIELCKHIPVDLLQWLTFQDLLQEVYDV